MDYLTGQPLAISGNFEKGKFVLSYSHLETPQSPHANALFCEILGEFCGLEPASRQVPEWSPAKDCAPAPRHPCSLAEAAAFGSAKINALLQLGEKLRLFFPRSSWLMGWRSGLPGMACNNLRMAFDELRNMKSSEAAENLWCQVAGEFMPKVEKFLEDAEACLWDIRLGKTLESDIKSGPHATELARLFGHPMLGGGIAEELLEILEELIYLGQNTRLE